MARRAASLITAKDSTSRSFSSSPFSRRSRNSTVLWARSSSERRSSSGSRALMSGTRLCSARTFFPSPARRILVKIPMRSPSLPADLTSSTRAGVGGDLASVGPAANVEQALPDGEDHRFHAGVEVKLLEDVAHMVLDGVLGDVEGVGDLTVAHAFGHQLEHLELACGERRRRVVLTFLRPLGQDVELPQQLRGHGRRDHALTLDRGPDGLSHLLNRYLLQEV